MERNAYRLMYVVNLRQATYALHAFMKKSKSGVGLPKPDADLIQARLQRAIESVTIDRLTAWLAALGRTVEIHVRPYQAKARTGHLIAAR